jgi:uncharacterized DUF497 family protein
VEIQFEVQGESFRWDSEKASTNVTKHGVSFEDAAWVFLDPFFITLDATRNDEARDALIGSGQDEPNSLRGAHRLPGRLHPNHFCPSRHAQ